MEVVILAAGKGTRMFSTKPKVMHTLGGRPMLHRVVEAARAVNADGVHVVIGYGAEQIKTEFKKQKEYELKRATSRRCTPRRVILRGGPGQQDQQNRFRVSVFSTYVFIFSTYRKDIFA